MVWWCITDFEIIIQGWLSVFGLMKHQSQIKMQDTPDTGAGSIF